MTPTRSFDLLMLAALCAGAPLLGGCSVIFGLDEYQASACGRPSEGAYRYVEGGQGFASLTVVDLPQTGGGGAGGGGMGGSGGGSVVAGGAGGSEPIFEVNEPLDGESQASVAHGDGCEWNLSIRRSARESEVTSYRGVQDGDKLSELGSVQETNWPNFGSSTTTINCQVADVFRPGMQVDQSWIQQCSGTTEGQVEPLFSNTQMTYLGRETLTLPSGRQVDTHKFQRKSLYSNALGGQQTADMWFEVATGLQIKVTRDLELFGDVDGGGPRYKVTFRESSDLILAE